MHGILERKRTGAARWLLPFVTGFLTGVLLWNFGGSAFTEQSGLLDEYTLGTIRSMELNHGAFFWYVLQQRIGTLWLLALISSTFAGLYLLYAYVVWLGLSGGIVLSAAVIRYGIKGIILAVTGCVPHYLLYLPAVFFALNLGCSFWSSLYGQEQRYSSGRKGSFLRYGLFFLLLHLIILAGAFLESYVNPTLVTKLLHIF